MTQEHIAKQYIAGILGAFKAEGYTTLEISLVNTKDAELKYQAYNQHSGIHRGETAEELIATVNAANKPLHEQMMDSAAKLRTQADSIEAKARAIIEAGTPSFPL